MKFVYMLVAMRRVKYCMNMSTVHIFPSVAKQKFSSQKFTLIFILSHLSGEGGGVNHIFQEINAEF